VQIVTYPHPTLRHASQPVRRVDAELRRIVGEMFELMYAAKGVGLAANQVDLPLRLFVVNEKADPGAKNLERVFINPVLSRRKGLAEGEEGCLSLPGLYGEVARAEKIFVHAYDLAGNEIKEEVGDMLARVVQHETDHLDGVLFIDRLSSTGRLALKEPLDEFELIFQRQRERGEIADDAALAELRAEWEKKYC
jgi:peptide deformylase